MRMHPVISVLLAVSFALGGTLIPRSLCVCADGTVSVEFGHELCCDAEGSRSASCDCTCPGMDTEPRKPGVALTCSGGCESVPVIDNILVYMERDYKKGQCEDRPVDILTLWLDRVATVRATPREVAYLQRPPNTRFAPVHQLRSVILLV